MAKKMMTQRAKPPKARPAPVSNKTVAKKPVPVKRPAVVRKTLPAPAVEAVAMITDIRETVIPPPPVLVLAPVVTYEQIAVRAYEIYRARMDATPEDDWLRAERELRGS